MTSHVCRHCDGKGKVALVPTLEEVLSFIPKRGTGKDIVFGELRDLMAARGIRLRPGLLHERLAALVRHELLHRSLTDDGYAWSRR